MVRYPTRMTIATKPHTKDVLKRLQQLLADECVVYIKTRNFHWNVEQLKEAELVVLLAQQFESLEHIADMISQYIRQHSTDATDVRSNFLELARLREQPKKKDIASTEMLQELLSDHEATIRQLEEDIGQCATKYNDRATAALLATIMAEHVKMAWCAWTSLQTIEE